MQKKIDANKKKVAAKTTKAPAAKGVKGVPKPKVAAGKVQKGTAKAKAVAAVSKAKKTKLKVKKLYWT